MRLAILTTACLVAASSAAVFAQRGDFNGDGQYSCHDVDRLWQEFDSPSPDLATFDLNMDGVLDGAGFGGPRNDFGELLGIASQYLGYPIVPGDFAFNGTTDRRDFLYVTANYNRGHVDGYCAGDIDNDVRIPQGFILTFPTEASPIIRTLKR